MKPTVKINFSDFWRSFNKKDNYFWNLLSKEYSLKLSENPDFLIYAHTGDEFRNYDCIRIQFMGEPYPINFKECDYAFSFFYINHPGHFRLPLYILYEDLNQLVGRNKNPQEILDSKSKFCAFVVSNKYSYERNRFFEKLTKYKKVDSGGRFMNNVGGPVENKMDFIKDYKFVLSFENVVSEGYTTEKAFESLLVDSVPVYKGNPLVHKDFNTKRFINWHDYKNDEEVINRIIELDQNDDLYRQMVAEPAFPSDRIPEGFSDQAILNQFKKIFEKSEKITPVAIKNPGRIKKMVHYSKNWERIYMRKKKLIYKLRNLLSY